MRKTTVCSLIIVLLFAVSAHAGEFADLKKKMVDARRTLYILLTDNAKQGADQQKQVKETADSVSAMLAAMKPNTANAAKLKELTTTWKAFKKTREEELVPLILSGKHNEAEKIATGVQMERFSKMMELCDELEKELQAQQAKEPVRKVSE